MHILKLYTRGENLTLSDVFIRECRDSSTSTPFTSVSFNVDGFNPDLARVTGFFRTNGPVVETLVEEVGPNGTDMFSIGEKRIGGVQATNGCIVIELRNS